jgi:dolichyl-phosphate-mannose--protein O-mannosyl transferase
MTRKDYLFAAAFALFDLLLCGAWYWFPPERYFDEIYYPRSAAEYLQWQPQYEWTHPPLTKLLIALSMLLFGGIPHGDTAYGWRFLNVVIGAALVFLLYVFAKRLTKSTPFACIAAALMVFDGFHFTQSRIATPEITVAFFSLLILYSFYRYWTAVAQDDRNDTPPASSLVPIAIFAILIGLGVSIGVIGILAHQSPPAVDVMAAFCVFTMYAAARLLLRPRPRALLWLFVVAIACGLGAASKWNALFDLVLVMGFALGIVLLPRPKWRLPFDAFVAIVMSLTIGLYLASYIPFFFTKPPATYELRSDLSGLMDLQNQMYTYHDVTVTHNAPHPYSSKWWEWPLLYQPVVYWDKDSRTGANANNPNACCFAEIISLPNPLTWWFGLVSIPFLGYLAFRALRRAQGDKRGYLLLFSAYWIQWLPWIASPRMLFEYHFFPNDAIILLADTVALKWLWDRAHGSAELEQLARYGIALFLVGTVALFAYFYPVLAGVPMVWADWNARMWFPHWIIGPG